MKILFTVFTVLILLSGCATRNAFSNLGLSEEQELALENTKDGKLVSQAQVGGVYSVVYLNNVSSNIDKNSINFYLSIYLKESSENIKLTMNNQNPNNIKKLASENEFSHLLPKKSEWSKNYLVSFNNNENNETINLLIESDQFSSDQLHYLKDQQ